MTAIAAVRPDPRAFYFAHPVAPPCGCAALIAELTEGTRLRDHTPSVARSIRQLQVECNLKRARRWFRWLLEHTDVALVASWMPYLDTVPDDGTDGIWRRRGLRDDAAVCRRCDGIILCGGSITAGMRGEADAVSSAGGVICDLTHLGLEPPIYGTEALPACLH